MASSYESETLEDVSGQAGWMFSDMLVALMVVFLATISFIPQYMNSNSSSFGDGSTSAGSSNTFTYTDHFDAAFVRVYESSDVSGILKEVKAFLKDNNIPNSAVIDSAQFVGGYDQTKESSGVAIQRATAFSSRLEKAYPEILKHASTVLNSSPKLAKNLVALKFTFSADVTVKR